MYKEILPLGISTENNQIEILQNINGEDNKVIVQKEHVATLREWLVQAHSELYGGLGNDLAVDQPEQKVVIEEETIEDELIIEEDEVLAKTLVSQEPLSQIDIDLEEEVDTTDELEAPESELDESESDEEVDVKVPELESELQEHSEETVALEQELDGDLVAEDDVDVEALLNEVNNDSDDIEALLGDIESDDTGEEEVLETELEESLDDEVEELLKGIDDETELSDDSELDDESVDDLLGKINSGEEIDLDELNVEKADTEVDVEAILGDVTEDEINAAVESTDKSTSDSARKKIEAAKAKKAK